ncbi:MAG: DUF4142 domain-containing protein [Verrucomicrobia subdivision 3 bacterium]|nr:DUF4142 domain-containing protein [Limisphaerales bacterium]
MKKLIIVTASLALLAGCAQRDESVGASGSGESAAAGVAGVTETGEPLSQLAAADAKFVETAAQSGMMEVRMGQLISEAASSQPLREFGDRLVKDHTKANQELTQIASRKGFTVPTQTAAKHEEMLDGLSKLKGAEFERVVQKHAVEHHQEDIQLYEKASQTLQDAELKVFAAKTLGVLKEHLALAKGLETGSTTETAPTP